MNKEKILFLTQLSPPVHGVSVMNDYIKQSKKINECYKTDFINTTSAVSLSDLGKGTLQKYVDFLMITISLLKKLFVERYDLCYITLAPTGIAFWKDSILLLLSKIFIKKRIIHLHGRGASATIDESPWKKWIYEIVFKDTLVIVLSERLKTDILSFVNPEQIRVLPNGIERIERLSSKVLKDKPIILFLSNLIVSKGVYTFVDIIAKLKESKEVFEAWMVGGEGDVSIEALKKYIDSKNVSSHIKVLGPKFGNNKYEVMNDASILIYPSQFDAFPLVLLEAMQFGLPIIATGVGGIPDMIEDGRTGFILKYNDNEGFVYKTQLLLRNKELSHKMGQEAMKEFSKKYTLEIFENNLIDIIENNL